MKSLTDMKMRFLPLLAISLGMLAILTVGCGKENDGQDVHHAAEGDAQFANTTCPMMGNAIDPTKVTPELTRMHGEQKVAFCCGMCPPKWDALTDDEKDAKLAETSD